MGGNATELLICYHCGNTTPHQRVGYHTGRQLYDQFEEVRCVEDFELHLYRCTTCEGISVFGDFISCPRWPTFSARRIYPRGSHLLPEAHKLASRDCVPQRIVKLYDEVAPLRHIAPNAFAAQIRRVLEMICQDRQAQGDTLFQQLKDLVARGTFPGYFAEITDLMRRIGNLGAHSGDTDVDRWDAELLDDFFRAVIEYVYIAPSKIERLKQRLSMRNT